MSDRCMVAVAKSARDYRVFRISPQDTNRIATVFDPKTAASSLAVCVEIFDEAGKTPLHCHHRAVEMFYILKGEALATCDGRVLRLETGDSVLVPPTGLHELCNVGSGRLYVLCVMVPNEDFVEAIYNGTPAELDEEDLRVLRRSDCLVPC
ncbi:cupin domain-containing protein [Geitlerinema sp. CS-897]|uniref:cupin domain-containing protein n=1 Tax=Baaleninema simplex TaxID=2862350 RepID=UPI000B3088CC|nr:cupin domain-containing protein [Baaleninema simplex]MDC0832072.1 cupin domain-containing protein [Geitlerinema sp. CS-897]